MKNTKEVVNEEVSKIVSQLDLNKLIEKSINSNLYNYIKNDSEITELTNLLKEDINKELNTIVLNEFNKIQSVISSNMSNVQNEDISFIVENYGLTEEQAKEIVNKVQGDTLNQVKKNVSEANIPGRIISVLNDKNYVSNLVNNYINELNNKLSESLNKDTTISEYSKEVKNKIISSIKKDLEEGNLYLNKNIRDYISELVDKIIDNTSKDLSKKYTEDYTNKIVKRTIEKQFSKENVDSKLRKLLDIYEEDINKKVSVLDDTINTLSDSLNKLNNGSKQISKGMKTLSNGLDKYNKEGINKINKLVNGDVKTLQKRMNALKELSNENKMIDNSPTNSSNNSKIIFMIDSVSIPDNNKDKVKEEKKDNSFRSKIKGLFD
jgi:X-X-X-Leu-X-X-Gly heptad repeat protein